MRTSISTTFNYDIPIEEQLLLIKQSGFTHLSLGMNYAHSRILEEAGLERLADLIAEIGLQVDTVHGYDLDQEDTLEINEKIAKAAVRLGAPIVVLHCSAFWFPEEAFDEKKRIVSPRIKALEKIAEKYHIRFALENVVPGEPTRLCEEMVRLGNPEYIGFCFDSSHDQIDGPNSMDLLNRMKSRLIAVHMSDRIKEFVDHVVPGEGFIHFEEIIPLLREAGFNSPMLMEVEMTHSKYKDVREFLQKVHAAAEELSNGIQ